MNRPRLLASAFIAALCVSAPASAQLFGPSDEEKAREAAQTQGISDLQNRAQVLDSRVHELEERVRGLTQSLSQVTGTNEELQHQIQVQNGKVEQMQRDFAYRLCQLSAQQMGAGDAMNCAAAGTPSAGQPAGNMGGGAYVAPQPYSNSGLAPGSALPPINATGNGPAGFTNAPPPDEAPPVRGRPPGTLGTLPMGAMAQARWGLVRPAHPSSCKAPPPATAPNTTRR